jgi:hypothetical protein
LCRGISSSNLEKNFIRILARKAQQQRFADAPAPQRGINGQIEDLQFAGCHPSVDQKPSDLPIYFRGQATRRAFAPEQTLVVFFRPLRRLGTAALKRQQRGEISAGCGTDERFQQRFGQKRIPPPAV